MIFKKNFIAARHLRAAIFLKLSFLWGKTTINAPLSMSDRLFFQILCFFEFFYRIAFFCIQSAKRYFCHRFRSSATIISVGNLSVGGTGKSVFVQFLVRNLAQRCGIVSRGYGRVKNDTARNLLVSDGKHIFCGPRESGDEPFMLAQTLGVPCAVGVHRAEATKLLELNAFHNERPLDVIILDDGYQNEQLYKDVQVLLVDARRPLENGHCLPAGRLREKDFTRADIIVVTHADLVSVVELQNIRRLFHCPDRFIPIVHGIHKPAQVVCYGFSDAKVTISDHSFFACAGIGSFSRFLQTLNQLNIVPIGIREFADHHDYSQKDFDEIVQHALSVGCTGVVTTEKDWVKLNSYVEFVSEKKLLWCVVRVEFEFLTEQEYHTFMKVIGEKLS